MPFQIHDYQYNDLKLDWDLRFVLQNQSPQKSLFRLINFQIIIAGISLLHQAVFIKFPGFHSHCFENIDLKHRAIHIRNTQRSCFH